MPKKTDDFTPITGSSVVNGYRYEPDSRELTVRFNNGSVHAYEEVGAEKHATFEGAESKGRYLTTKIIPHHRSRRIK